MLSKGVKFGVKFNKQWFGAVLGAVCGCKANKQGLRWCGCCVGIYIKQMLGMVESGFLRLNFNFN